MRFNEEDLGTIPLRVRSMWQATGKAPATARLHARADCAEGAMKSTDRNFKTTIMARKVHAGFATSMLCHQPGTVVPRSLNPSDLKGVRHQFHLRRCSATVDRSRQGRQTWHDQRRMRGTQGMGEDESRSIAREPRRSLFTLGTHRDDQTLHHRLRCHGV